MLAITSENCHSRRLRVALTFDNQYKNQIRSTLIVGRCRRPSRNSSLTLTFAPARPAIHVRGAAQGVECFASGRVSILGLAFAARRLK